ncbi:hypothetical protein [Alkalinema sp. FACHB-956]|uniref:hypothetical protein n=1 Tax=Alkalinema sp. FACHB-956 TaxID=2692768 RepID=UPI0016845419|nr:hypothetical protein [Alkalinema sp. FACHB-956]MBD2327778.1 hypothetical protein [Alkalinema sp. FACHB-956]
MATKHDVGLRVRILLLLSDGDLRRSELLKGLRKKGETAKSHQAALDQLVKDGLIAVSAERFPMASLLDAGRSQLQQDLLNKEFEFTSQIGKRFANLLLGVMRSAIGNAPVVVASNGHNGHSTIESYEEFKTVALETFDTLNRSFNLDNLVPIYRIRREIGEKVSRDNFDEWLLEMQAEDIVQLQGGSLPDGDTSKLEDSITTELSGLRCYATILSQ